MWRRSERIGRWVLASLTILLAVGTMTDVSAAGAPAGRFSVSRNAKMPDKVKQAVFEATQEWQTVLNDDDLFDAAEPTRTNVTVVWDTAHDARVAKDDAVAVTKKTGNLTKPAYEIVLYKRDINRAFKQDGFATQEQQLRTIIVHELGHTMGLTHSTNKHDVMYPMALGPTQHITADDVRQLPFAVRNGVQQDLARQDRAWFAPRRWLTMLTETVVKTFKRPHSLEIAALSFGGALVVTVVGTMVYNRRGR